MRTLEELLGREGRLPVASAPPSGATTAGGAPRVVYGPPPGSGTAGASGSAPVQPPPASPPVARPPPTPEHPVLARGIAETRMRLRRCYNRRSARVENLGSLLTIRWTIDTRGVSRDVTIIGGDITDEWLRSCAVQQVGRVRYTPAPRTPGTITRHFPFSER